MKLLGSLLIFTASIGFAFQIRQDLTGHLQLLYDIRKLLLDVAAEAAYSFDSMETILKNTVKSRNPYLNEMCAAMGRQLEKKETGAGKEVWESVIESYQDKLHLTCEEKEIVISAGAAFFGKSMEENEKSLAHYVERLDYVIDSVRSEQKEKQKVYQTVSVMCGLIVILLFL